MSIHTFEDVIAWRKSRELTLEIDKSFCHITNYAYKDQLFRASLSIMNNISEGFDRGTNKELKQFLTIARGSAAEVRSMLIIAPELGYIDTEKQKHLLCLAKEISKLLTGFIKSLQPTTNSLPQTTDH